MIVSLAAALLLLSSSEAFTPSTKSAATFHTAQRVSGARPARAAAFVIGMAEGDGDEVSAESKIGADGTFYDDEVRTQDPIV